MNKDTDQVIARKGRHVALVIAGSMTIWVVVQLIAPKLGLPGRFALLIDFMALAALVYAGVNIMQLWRLRRESKG